MTHEEIQRDNIARARAMKEARIRHADEIDAIEREVNAVLGGDATVGEIVALMAARGWQRPSR